MNKEVSNTPSFPGAIEGIPDIYVDNFTDRNKKAYFLSHFHADHTAGLFRKSKLEHAKVYMTKRTQDIVRNYCYTSKLFKNISTRVLTPGKTYKNFQNLRFDVTAVPVVHMPGAVMFLFKSSDGKKILYTGDFIIKQGDLSDLTMFKKLHEGNGKKRTPMKFDLVYYDDIFENVKSLPERRVCIEEATAVTKDWLALGDDRQVVFHRPYDYGFEDLFTGICKALETKITLSQIKKSQHDVYGIIFENKPEELVYTKGKSKLRICTLDKGAHTQCITANKDEKTLHFHIYTLGWRHPNATYKESDNVYHLCFPTHCSKSLLIYFFEHFEVKERVAFSEAIRSCLESKTPNQQTSSTVPERPRKDSSSSVESEPGGQQIDGLCTAMRKLDF